MLGNSAKTSLGKPAASPWASAAGSRSSRASYVARQAALERSAQAALARSEEAKRKQDAKRKLAFRSPKQSPSFLGFGVLNCHQVKKHYIEASAGQLEVVKGGIDCQLGSPDVAQRSKRDQTKSLLGGWVTVA